LTVQFHALTMSTSSFRPHTPAMQKALHSDQISHFTMADLIVVWQAWK
jgi:hypothetical protein